MKAGKEYGVLNYFKFIGYKIIMHCTGVAEMHYIFNIAQHSLQLH